LAPEAEVFESYLETWAHLTRP